VRPRRCAPRLLAEVDERRNPRTNATVNQLLDRYLGVLEIEDTTRAGYESILRNYIRPLLGELSIARINGETLDSFYAELRRCHARCDRRPRIDHRTAVEHKCDRRCAPHVCKPLGGSYLRQIHTLLNGAFGRAVRWQWLGTNPVQQSDAPAQPRPMPDPPAPHQAARIVEEAWADPDWGMLVWLAITTGARRSELCALRWDRLDFGTGVLSIRSAMAQVGKRAWEKDTKTHQHRRIVLDPQTLALMRGYLQRCAQQAALLGIDLRQDSYIFSTAPDHAAPMRPDTVTQRYSRMCTRLGWTMHIHQLRHYSATELIAAGVDVRTVAGRLGHGGGGATTLRVSAPGPPRPTSEPLVPSPAVYPSCPRHWTTPLGRSRCRSLLLGLRRRRAHTSRSRPTSGPPSAVVPTRQAITSPARPRWPTDTESRSAPRTARLPS